jgi:hypothetical protein
MRLVTVMLVIKPRSLGVEPVKELVVSSEVFELVSPPNSSGKDPEIPLLGIKLVTALAGSHNPFTWVILPTRLGMIPKTCVSREPPIPAQ